MNTPMTPEIYKAIRESWRHAPRPKRSTINKVLAFFQLAKPTCEGLFTYKTTQNGVRTIELQAACSMEIDASDPPKPLIYSCTCKYVENGTCPSLQLVRKRISDLPVRHDNCMPIGKPQVKANVIDCDGETGLIDDANGDVVITDFMNAPHWCNQQLYPVVVYRTPGVDDAKYGANSSNRQCNRLQQSDFVHVGSFSNSQIEKDITP